MLLCGLVIMVLFLLCALFAPQLAPYGFSQTKADGVSFVPQSAPGEGHVLGTTVGGLMFYPGVIWGSARAFGDYHFRGGFLILRGLS